MNLYEPHVLDNSSEPHPEIRMDVLVRFSENNRKHRDLGDVAEAGELLHAAWSHGQAGQLPDHKVHHIVSVPLGVHAIDLPAQRAAS